MASLGEFDVFINQLSEAYYPVLFGSDYYANGGDVLRKNYGYWPRSSKFVTLQGIASWLSAQRFHYFNLGTLTLSRVDLQTEYYSGIASSFRNNDRAGCERPFFFLDPGAWEGNTTIYQYLFTDGGFDVARIAYNDLATNTTFVGEIRVNYVDDPEFFFYRTVLNNGFKDPGTTDLTADTDFSAIMLGDDLDPFGIIDVNGVSNINLLEACAPDGPDNCLTEGISRCECEQKIANFVKTYAEAQVAYRNEYGVFLELFSIATGAGPVNSLYTNLYETLAFGDVVDFDGYEPFQLAYEDFVNCRDCWQHYYIHVTETGLSSAAGPPIIPEFQASTISAYSRNTQYRSFFGGAVYQSFLNPLTMTPPEIETLNTYVWMTKEPGVAMASDALFDTGGIVDGVWNFTDARDKAFPVSNFDDRDNRIFKTELWIEEYDAEKIRERDCYNAISSPISLWNWSDCSVKPCQQCKTPIPVVGGEPFSLYFTIPRPDIFETWQKKLRFTRTDGLTYDLIVSNLSVVNVVTFPEASAGVLLSGKDPYLPNVPTETGNYGANFYGTWPPYDFGEYQVDLILTEDSEPGAETVTVCGPKLQFVAKDCLDLVIKIDNNETFGGVPYPLQRDFVPYQTPLPTWDFYQLFRIRARVYEPDVDNFSEFSQSSLGLTKLIYSRSRDKYKFESDWYDATTINFIIFALQHDNVLLTEGDYTTFPPFNEFKRYIFTNIKKEWADDGLARVTAECWPHKFSLINNNC